MDSYSLFPQAKDKVVAPGLCLTLKQSPHKALHHLVPDTEEIPPAYPKDTSQGFCHRLPAFCSQQPNKGDKASVHIFTGIWKPIFMLSYLQYASDDQLYISTPRWESDAV